MEGGSGGSSTFREAMTETPVIVPLSGERELETGDKLGGYTLVRMVGRGGMGEVWEATAPHGGSVALKRIRDAQASRDQRRRFVREARAASAVEHPAVVRVDAIFEDETGQPVMVMELLEGEPLAERLARDGELPAREVAIIMTPVLEAVACAHEIGIVHRDLKPENIFLAEADDGRIEPRVLDFGIAKLVADEAEGKTAGLTTTGSILGTPCYMAPEQVFGERDLDHRVDVWALGIMLYQMLTGLLPTRADNVGQVLKIIVTRGIWPLRETAPDLPDPVAEMVDRMLARERDDRPESLDEVIEVLRPFVDSDAVPPSRDVQRSRPAIARVEPTVAQAPALTPPGISVANTAPPGEVPRAARLPWIVAAVAVMGSVVWVQSRSPVDPTAAATAASPSSGPDQTSSVEGSPSPAASTSVTAPPKPSPPPSATASPSTRPAPKPTPRRLRPRPAPVAATPVETAAPAPPPPPDGGLAGVPDELK